MSREQQELQLYHQHEEEKERMKQLMIRICSHLEGKYKPVLEEIIYNTDMSIHYEVDVE